jgi:hypothetical protein
MMANAQKLGLALDKSMLTRYPSPLDPKYALDTLHDSWSPLWLFPKVRAIAPNATLSSSVNVRCTQNSAGRDRAARSPIVTAAVPGQLRTSPRQMYKSLIIRPGIAAWWTS